RSGYRTRTSTNSDHGNRRWPLPAFNPTSNPRSVSPEINGASRLDAPAEPGTKPNSPTVNRVVPATTKATTARRRPRRALPRTIDTEVTFFSTEPRNQNTQVRTTNPTDCTQSGTTTPTVLIAEWSDR